MASSFFKTEDEYLYHRLTLTVKVVLAFSLGAHSSREGISRRIMVAVLSQPSTVISRAQSGSESGDDGGLSFRLHRSTGNGIIQS